LSKLFKAAVKANEKLTENHFLITLHPLEKIKKPKPGQFFMLSVDSGLDPLLKRPFSVHRWLGTNFQLLYRTVGKATVMLKGKSPGSILEIMGPLGNGFPKPERKTKKVLIAGGQVFIGARNKREALCIDKLKSIGINPLISTDDGSIGTKGLILDLVSEFLAQNTSRISDICLYSCGPKPMLKELTTLVSKFTIKGYFALEENMACGLGACLSCVVNTRSGFKRVCVDGPVFPASEIVW
jgi:dihydroorotate dehydrogenase electron transfer subunit